MPAPVQKSAAEANRSRHQEPFPARWRLAVPRSNATLAQDRFDHESPHKVQDVDVKTRLKRIVPPVRAKQIDARMGQTAELRSQKPRNVRGEQDTTRETTQCRRSSAKMSNMTIGASLNLHGYRPSGRALSRTKRRKSAIFQEIRNGSGERAEPPTRESPSPPPFPFFRPPAWPGWRACARAGRDGACGAGSTSA